MAAKQLFLLGIALEVLSTLSGTAGKQLIRLSELTKRKAPGCSRTALYAGLIINTIAGPILDMAAYSFAAQSLIAPFGGLDVVWNAALAPYILKERLTRSRLCACGLIFFGTLGSGLFGSHQEEAYTVELLQEKLLDIRVPMYIAGVVSFVIFNVLVPMRRPKGDIIRGISLGMTGGVIAGNMFCVKIAVELMETSIWNADGTVWLHWLPYAALVGAATFAITNVFFMTRGLLEFEALFMVTIYEGSMIVSNCVSASVVLLELDGLEAWRVALYTLCVSTVCLGMIQICMAESKTEKKCADGENATVLGGQDQVMKADVDLDEANNDLEDARAAREQVLAQQPSPESDKTTEDEEASRTTRSEKTTEDGENVEDLTQPDSEPMSSNMVAEQEPRSYLVV